MFPMASLFLFSAFRSSFSVFKSHNVLSTSHKFSGENKRFILTLPLYTQYMSGVAATEKLHRTWWGLFVGSISCEASEWRLRKWLNHIPHVNRRYVSLRKALSLSWGSVGQSLSQAAVSRDLQGMFSQLSLPCRTLDLTHQGCLCFLIYKNTWFFCLGKSCLRRSPSAGFSMLRGLIEQG